MGSSKGRVFMHATSAMAARVTSLIQDQVGLEKSRTTLPNGFCYRRIIEMGSA